jgi:hypothetical protein
LGLSVAVENLAPIRQIGLREKKKKKTHLKHGV